MPAHQPASGLLHLLRVRREEIIGSKPALRLVYRSELIRKGADFDLDTYVAERAPYFYRKVSAIVADIQDGYFLSAIKRTLAKVPTSQSFQESHFGEIIAGIFAEEVLGWRRLYSKLTLLTAENANAYKMDLVLYDPAPHPVEFIFAEVKCSPKSAEDGLPAKHDKSCFADIFTSFNEYASSDRDFDLAAAKDHLDDIPKTERDRVRSALKPYSGTKLRYAAVAVIDVSTYSPEEAQVLRTRKNEKPFGVDVVCLEAYAPVAGGVYSALGSLFGKEQ